jgi:hypothetical protein
MAGEGPPSTTFLRAATKVVDADLRRHDGEAGQQAVSRFVHCWASPKEAFNTELASGRAAPPWLKMARGGRRVRGAGYFHGRTTESACLRRLIGSHALSVVLRSSVLESSLNSVPARVPPGSRVCVRKTALTAVRIRTSGPAMIRSRARTLSRCVRKGQGGPVATAAGDVYSSDTGSNGSSAASPMKHPSTRRSASRPISCQSQLLPGFRSCS